MTAIVLASLAGVGGALVGLACVAFPAWWVHRAAVDSAVSEALYDERRRTARYLRALSVTEHPGLAQPALRMAADEVLAGLHLSNPCQLSEHPKG